VIKHHKSEKFITLKKTSTIRSTPNPIRNTHFEFLKNSFTTDQSNFLEASFFLSS
jgi:hypothetical protein